MIFFFLILSLFSAKASILTIDKDISQILRKESLKEMISPKDLEKAQTTIQQLFQAINPHMPAAGLAAPQIGISKPIFIFSWDRSVRNMQGAINPIFHPIGKEMVERWEGCFSVILSENGPYAAVKIPRYKAIKASFLGFDGQKVILELKGFAASVFQHEYDHLKGIVNIDHPNAEIKSFSSKSELTAFLSEIKKSDLEEYIPPQIVDEKD